MIHEITFPDTFDNFINNYTKAEPEQINIGAKLVPVKQWERDEFGSYCSCCGYYAYRDKFGKPWESNFCPNCGADLRKKDGQKPMKPTKKDYSQAIESVLWYSELWPIVQKWKYRPVDQGQITAPPAYGCSNPEANPQTYYQLQLIWMIAVELFGDCGTSPKYGWITDVVGFRRWITDLTNEPVFYASERENKEKQDGRFNQ